MCCYDKILVININLQYLFVRMLVYNKQSFFYFILTPPDRLWSQYSGSKLTTHLPVLSKVKKS
jgi:hypothetical protein